MALHGLGEVFDNNQMERNRGEKISPVSTSITLHAALHGLLDAITYLNAHSEDGVNESCLRILNKIMHYLEQQKNNTNSMRGDSGILDLGEMFMSEESELLGSDALLDFNTSKDIEKSEITVDNNCVHKNEQSTTVHTESNLKAIVVAEPKTLSNGTSYPDGTDLEESVRNKLSPSTQKLIIYRDGKVKNSGLAYIRCEVCRKSVKGPGGLRRHMSTHDVLKPSVCTECGKGFSRPSHLQDHIRTHTGERPFTCSVCSKTFCHASALHVHKRTHTGERPYQCAACGKVFTHFGALQTHTRTHTGERPYTCNVCSKRFVQSNALHEHQRIHTGEKPYRCTICGREFVQSSSLTEHHRTHSGERPHQCVMCGRSFTQSSTLHRHMNLHSGHKEFQCPTCNRNFSRSSHLKRHLNTHNKQVTSSEVHVAREWSKAHN